MKALLLVIGPTDKSYIKAGIEEYLKRIGFYIPFELKILPDLKNRSKLSFDVQKEKEGEAILSSVQISDYLVLLDENGKEFSSVDFAQWIQKRMLSGVKQVIFVIGGPYGFSNAVYERSDSKISLSRMTFSHQMVRMIFVEQLYRAMTILNNEPYHHP